MEKNEIVIQMCLDGYSYAEIRAKVGLCLESIRKIARSAGIPPRKTRTAHLDIQDAVVGLYNKEIPLNVIGQQFGIREHTVIKIIRRAGLSLRKTPLDQTIKARVINARLSGLSRPEVAANLGLDRRQVGAVCRRVGL